MGLFRAPAAARLAIRGRFLIRGIATKELRRHFAWRRPAVKELEDVLEYIVEIVPPGPASPSATAAWFAAQLNGAANKGLQFSGIVTINGTQMILYKKA